MADPFVAEIRIFPFNFAPKGWAWCDGQLLPLSQNTALFSLLGTTYGGNGKSNFALPDLQGRAPMHPGQGPGLSLHDLGETGGSETVTLLESEIPAHTHCHKRHQRRRQQYPAGGADTPARGNTLSMPPRRTNLVAMSRSGAAPAGGDLPHNNMHAVPHLLFQHRPAGRVPAARLSPPVNVAATVPFGWARAAGARPDVSPHRRGRPAVPRAGLCLDPRRGAGRRHHHDRGAEGRVSRRAIPACSMRITRNTIRKPTGW